MSEYARFRDTRRLQRRDHARSICGRKATNPTTNDSQLQRADVRQVVLNFKIRAWFTLVPKGLSRRGLGIALDGTAPLRLLLDSCGLQHRHRGRPLICDNSYYRRPSKVPL